MHMKTSMKSLMERFMKAPYGFVEDDVEWLVAKLFKDGDVSFTLSGSSITLLNKSADEIIRYITKKEFVEKLLIEQREKANETQKKTVREIMKELFGISSVNDDDDSIMRSFQTYSQKMLTDLEKLEIIYQSNPFPGKQVVATGKNLLREVVQIESPMEFFHILAGKQNDYLDFAEDYEPVKAFFGGEQKAIFEKALGLIRIYDDSKTFIVDETVESAVKEIKAILNKDMPYSDIPKLPELLDRFTQAYMKVRNDMEAPIIAAIEDARKRVMDVLENKAYQSQFSERFQELFEELLEKASNSNNVATLQNIKVEADTLKVRLLNEMSKMDEKIAKDRAAEGDTPYGGGEKADPNPQSKIKKRKNISINSLNLANSWQIETEQDVDKYITALKERILKELEVDTVINIEF